MNTISPTPNSVNSVNSVEVLSPPATASDEQVLAAYRAAEGAIAEVVQSPQFKSATRRTIISGLLLAEKRKEIGHGNWLPWCAKHSVEDRTARRHIETSKAACDTLQIGHGVRFDDLPLHRVLELPAAQLVNSAKETREKFDNLIDSKSTKEIVVEWKDADGAKGKRELHDIKFHCPHCGAKNKGKLNRTIKCVNAECGKKIQVRADGPTAEAKIAAIIKGEQEVVADLIAGLEQWRQREHRAEAGRDLLQQLSDALIEANREAKRFLKRGARSAERGTRGKK